MYWPPTWSPNNVMSITDSWYVDQTSLAQRFAPFSAPVTVLAPWLARTDQDTIWVPGDPILRCIICGPSLDPFFSKNNSTYGAVLQACNPGVGSQYWEVVSSFACYQQGNPDEAGSFIWARLIPGFAPPMHAMGIQIRLAGASAPSGMVQMAGTRSYEAAPLILTTMSAGGGRGIGLTGATATSGMVQMTGPAPGPGGAGAIVFASSATAGKKLELATGSVPGGSISLTESSVPSPPLSASGSLSLEGPGPAAGSLTLNSSAAPAPPLPALGVVILAGAAAPAPPLPASGATILAGAAAPAPPLPASGAVILAGAAASVLGQGVRLMSVPTCTGAATGNSAGASVNSLTLTGVSCEGGLILVSFAAFSGSPDTANGSVSWNGIPLTHLFTPGIDFGASSGLFPMSQSYWYAIVTPGIGSLVCTQAALAMGSISVQAVSCSGKSFVEDYGANIGDNTLPPSDPGRSGSLLPEVAVVFFTLANSTGAWTFDAPYFHLLSDNSQLVGIDMIDQTCGAESLSMGGSCDASQLSGTSPIGWIACTILVS